MNSKAIKRQLLAAIAMVLVAALALGSSTFAWFANNNTVKADGMQINAATEGTMLVISDSKAGLGDKKTAHTFSPLANGENLLPIHPVYTGVSGGTVAAWNHAYSDNFTTAISNSKETAIAAEQLSGKYYLTTDLYIGLDDTNNTAAVGAITVTKVTLTSPDNTMLGSARVLMVDESGKVIGCFGNGTCLSTKGTEYAEGTAATADTMTALSETNTGTVIDGLSAGDDVKVTLYIYFDGRDDSCTSAKFNANAVTCALEFTAAPAAV